MTSSTFTVVPQITALASPVVSVRVRVPPRALPLYFSPGVAPTIVRCLNADEIHLDPSLGHLGTERSSPVPDGRRVAHDRRRW